MINKRIFLSIFLISNIMTISCHKNSSGSNSDQKNLVEPKDDKNQNSKPSDQGAQDDTQNSDSLKPFLSVCERSKIMMRWFTAVFHKECIDINASDLIGLSSVEIYSSQPIELKEGDFNGLFELRDLDLSFKSIPSLPEGIFQDLGKLVNLDLKGNDFNLYPGVFRGLKKVKKISLSHYRGQRGLFNPQVIIDLIGNPIEIIESFNGNLFELPQGGLYPLFPNLTFLDFRGGLIYELPDFAFKNLSNLSTLMLSENNISEIGKEVFLGCPKIKSLELDKNKISVLKNDCFNGLSNLTYLSLYKNEISKIELGSFNGLSNVKELKLSRNKINELPSGIFDRMPNLTKVSMFDNPICNNKDKLKVLREAYPTITIECGD